jgi:branched-chain amino acid transport system substrate-binding protein
VMVTCAALAATGCGSSSSSGSSGTASSSAAPSTTASASGGSSGATKSTATKSPVMVGSIGTYTGPPSANFAGADHTLDAWASWTNAHGGIDGHPVKLTVLNDGNSASAALNDAKRLVEQDHVVAIVGQMSANSSTWAKYVQQQGIPVIGGNLTDVLFWQNPDFFPAGTTSNVSIPDSVDASGVKNPKAAIFYCTENPVCSQSVPTYKSVYTKLGGSVVNTSSISSSSPNYTAQCLAAKSAGAQIINVLTNPQTLVTIAQNCAQQSYDPYFIVDAVALTPSIASQLGDISGFKGVFNADAFPFFENSTPATRAFRSALAQYGGSSVTDGKTFTENDAEAWASGQVFAAAAKAGGGSLDAASVLKGLYSLRGTTLGGLTPPLSYSKGKPTTLPCIYVVSVHDKQLTMPRGTKPYCPAGGAGA